MGGLGPGAVRIVILADDLTGANDSAVAFASLGFRTATAVCEPPRHVESRAWEAIAVASMTRALPPEKAKEAGLRAAWASGAQAGDLVYKKVDSALRGAVGAELLSALEAFPWVRRILVAPAFPANGRITVGGIQRIGGVPVHLTEMARDPLNPVRTSHIAQLLEEQAGLATTAIPLDIVEKGVRAVREAIASFPDAVRIVVADAAEDRHLDTLAELAAEAGPQGALLPCGSAGLAWAIARRLGRGRKGEGGQRARALPGPLLFVIGSKSERAVCQVEVLGRKVPWTSRVGLRVEDLKVEATRRNAVAEAAKRLEVAAAHGAALLHPVGNGDGVSPGAITEALGEVVAQAAAHVAFRTAVLGGGETAASVLTRLGVRFLEVRDEISPGVVRAVAVGGALDRTQVITKAGSFGDEDLLVGLVQRLQR